ncbi:MAG: TetR/AcrR family transcriptional regulator, partial [Candidatus Obscuribacterales bacterium]|nr:TetR/AcrR family transcriptional regulator [Candidatus Obscuribacterales bacterium]
MLREIGYERLSIEAIAARSGVSRTTVYRWYP